VCAFVARRSSADRLALTRDDPRDEKRGSSARRNVADTTTTTTAPGTTLPAVTEPPTAATTVPPPPPPPGFATVNCEVALGAINEFSLSDRLQLQALFQAFIGTAPASGGTALRVVGLPIASQSGDPYDAIWSPESGFNVTGGFFDFELLDDPASFPVIVFLDMTNNFVCEPNVPTGESDPPTSSERAPDVPICARHSPPQTSFRRDVLYGAGRCVNRRDRLQGLIPVVSLRPRRVATGWGHL